MKYIMLPIHSNWVCSIMNGIKKIEVRSGTKLYNAINKLIDEQGKAPCLMYCTQGGKQLVDLPQWVGNELHHQLYYDEHIALLENSQALLNGKVVAEFEAQAETILNRGSIETDTKNPKYFGGHQSNESYAINETISEGCLLEKSCLAYRELDTYLRGKIGTAIHIHNLKIFDKPKGLKDYGVEYSPQSYCYCEVEE